MKTLNLDKMFIFDADSIEMVQYVGPLLGDPGRRPKKVRGAILLANVQGQRRIIDYDGKGNFLKRYLDSYVSGVPLVSYSRGGRYAIQYDAINPVSVVRLVPYEEHSLLPPSLTLSIIEYVGLSVSGEAIVYDGFSKFRPIDLALATNLKNDTSLSWKVRFASKKYVVISGFLFKVIADEEFGEPFSLAHLPMLSAPPDILSKLRDMTVDYVQEACD